MERRKLAVAMAVVTLFALAGLDRAAGYTYTDATNNGNWDTNGTWTSSDGGTTYPKASDTATIATNAVVLDIALTGAAAPDKITLSGGKLVMSNDAFPRIDSPIDVTAPSHITLYDTTWPYSSKGFKLYGALTGSGSLTTSAVMLDLYDNAAGFSGAWNIMDSPNVRLYADGALGKGAVSFSAGAHRASTLEIHTTQTSTKAPSSLAFNGNFGGAPTGTFRFWNSIDGWNIVLTDAIFGGSAGTTLSGGSLTVNGTCKFAGNENGATSLIASPLLGSGVFKVSYGNAWVYGPVALSGDNTNFHGSFVLDDTAASRKLYVRNDQALGSAPVTLMYNAAGSNTLYLTKYTGASATPGNWTLANNLAGVGTIRVEDNTTYSLTSHGTISPGTSAGTLTIEGSLIIAGSLDIDLESLTVHDLLNVTKSVTLGGDLDVTLLPAYTPAPTDEWTIITSGTGVFGTFTSVTPGYDCRIDGNNVILFQVPPSAVPEPAAVSLLGLALLTLRRRRS